jgi:hypothetical protein
MKSPLDYALKLMRAKWRPIAMGESSKALSLLKHRGWIVAGLLLLAVWWAGCTPHAINDLLTSDQDAKSPPGARLLPPEIAPPEIAPGVEDDLFPVPTIRGSSGGDSGDPYARLFRLQDDIARDVTDFVRRLADQLGPRESAHVTTLHRVYSTGQCVRELAKWLDEPEHASAATAERRAELAELLHRWEQSEQLLVQLVRAK